MSSSPIVDRIRIIPRPSDFLDRNVGSSGQVYFNRESSSLRVYNGRDLSGIEIARADLNNVSDADLSARITELGISGSSGASVDVSATAPTEPEAGNLWLNTANGRLYIYINDGDTNQWMQPAVPVFSGSYNDLSDKPALATVATSGSYSDLTDKPTFGDSGFDGTFDSLSGTPTTLTGYGITDAATSAQGTLADTAVQPADLTSYVQSNVLTDYAQLVGAEFTGLVTLQQTSEVLVTLTGATEIVTHNLNDGAIFFHSNIVSDFTANFTNVPTTDNRATSVALLLVGPGSFIPNAVQIDGSAQTIFWQGGVEPVGSTAIDIVSFTLFRANDTWAVIGSLTNYNSIIG